MKTAFIQHTINWVTGEIFEAKIFGFFGLLIVICSAVFWKLSQAAIARALPVPLLVIGIFILCTAVINVSLNKKRIHNFTEAYKADKTLFIIQEKKRVEDFQYLYKISIAIACVCFLLAACFFVFTNNDQLKGVGISLFIFGLTCLVVDYFSKKRASVYYMKINNELKASNAN